VQTVAFANVSDYGAWHDETCAQYGIPYPPRDENGAPLILATWTTAFAEPRLIDGYCTVALPADVIDADPTLRALPVLTVRYPAEPGGTTDDNGEPASDIGAPGEIGETYHQTIPPQWTDPETGTVYDTTTGEPIA